MARESDGGHVSTDEIYSAVRNIRRRYLLYHLARNGGSSRLDEAVRHVADWESNGTSPSEEYRKSVYNSLYQTHVPELRDLGVVEYDPETREVSLTGSVRPLQVYFALDIPSFPWHKLYLALAGVGALVVVAGASGVVGEDARFVLTATVIGLFLCCSLAHAGDWYRWRDRVDEANPDVVVRLDEE